MARAWPFVLGAVLGLIVFVLSLVADAWGHEDLDWIAQQRLRNQAGEWCCGSGDCEALRSEDVRPADGGYLIVPLQEFVPQHETLPFSPGRFIRCHRPDGSRRCFIVPPQGS
ncbi:MAG TPA: hypothetical protein VJQ55_06370 [Candidatus Binatia bacterium]|nr:hypothetical protein [Candidatus Binatia bacterium]